MLQAAAPRRQAMDDEQVAVEGEAAEHRAGGGDDLAQVGQQARHVGVGGAVQRHLEGGPPHPEGVQGVGARPRRASRPARRRTPAAMDRAAARHPGQGGRDRPAAPGLHLHLAGTGQLVLQVEEDARAVEEGVPVVEERGAHRLLEGEHPPLDAHRLAARRPPPSAACPAARPAAARPRPSVTCRSYTWRAKSRIM